MNITEDGDNLNYYKLQQTMNDILANMKDGDQRQNVVLWTGEKGVDDFDITVVTERNTHDQLKTEYRKVRDQLYYLNKNYDRINNYWIVKILIKLNIIKL